MQLLLVRKLLLGRWIMITFQAVTLVYRGDVEIGKIILLDDIDKENPIWGFVPLIDHCLEGDHLNAISKKIDRLEEGE